MKHFLFMVVAALVMSACKPKVVTLRHGELTISFDRNMHSRIEDGSSGSPRLMDTFEASEIISFREFIAEDFKLIDAYSLAVADSMGTGNRWVLKGKHVTERYAVEKLLFVTFYDSFPNVAFYNASYINKSDREIHPEKWVNHRYEIIPENDSIPFWSFQGESTGARKDWVLPLKPGFRQRNYMGMNNVDYGGGIPVTDIWRRHNGMAVGHAEMVPKLVSLPVEVDQYTSRCRVGIQQELDGQVLPPGDTIETIRTFMQIHRGDYYNALSMYSRILQAEGMKFAEPEPEAFEPSWCAWGYMRTVTLDEIKGTLQKVKEMGIKWVTIDDGFQQAEGDWHVNERMFPKGDAQMRSLIDHLHAEGFKVMLWWAPLAADPGSELLRRNPEMKSVTADGAPHYITWWDAYYLSPLSTKTQEHTREILDLFLKQWDVDGLKMDGQHLNAVHPDHSISSPDASFEKLPTFYRMIYDEAMRIKKHSVIQLCPCGTCMSVFNMPHMNQSVASDPLSSWQIRLKGKTYKAIMPGGAYFGDHVELSDSRNDFATSFGIGAVLGTKFTWPRENPDVKEDNLLTPEKEITWKKWFRLYREKMLSREIYRGELYDIGYDFPETHVVQKQDTLHYAFYAEQWDGVVELRGLKKSRYHLRDYVNDKDLGIIEKSDPNLKVSFTGNMLIEAYPATE